MQPPFASSMVSVSTMSLALLSKSQVLKWQRPKLTSTKRQVSKARGVTLEDYLQLTLGTVNCVGGGTNKRSLGQMSRAMFGIH